MIINKSIYISNYKRFKNLLIYYYKTTKIMNTNLDNEWIIASIYTDYELTKSGKLRNKNTKLMLKDTSYNDGYVYNVLQKNGEAIKVSRHRIMAFTFLPNPKDLPTVNHKDLNPSNNSLDNLEWMSYSDQIKHSRKTNKNRKDPLSKKVIQFKNGKIIAKFKSIKEASLQTNICISDISQCCSGKRLSSKGFIWDYDDDDEDFDDDVDNININFEDEIWKNIEGSNAFVSTKGRFKNTNNIITMGTKLASDYYSCNISINGKFTSKQLHRLVAEAFIPNPNNYKVVNHKDGNKSNNCVENLEWVTHSENTNHYIENKIVKILAEKIDRTIARTKAKELVELILMNTNNA